MGKSGMMSLPRGLPCSGAPVALAVLLMFLAGATTSSAQSAGYVYQLPLMATETSISMAAVADTDKYIITGRARTATDSMVAGFVDLTPGAMTSGDVFSTHNRFCNGPIVWKDGLPLFIGGDAGNYVIGDGRKKIARWDPATNTIASISAVDMYWNRWYPTILRIDDNVILIVGGTQTGSGSTKVPVAESFDLSNPTGLTLNVTMPPTFARATGSNWYPFVRRLPKGDLIWFGQRGGTITDRNYRVLRDLPALPTTFPFNTMYPHTASISMLAYTFTNGYQPSFIIFGGAPHAANPASPAANVSARLDITYCTTHASGYCFGSWILESKLGMRHVMGDSLTLPNGDLLLHGGAQLGYAALPRNIRDPNKEGLPNVTPLMYNPDAALGSRYTALDNTPIVRTYHAAICQHGTGEVLVAGCETCYTRLSDQVPGTSPSPNAPDELRLEMVVPAAIAPGVVRPVINDVPKNMARGGTYTLAYTYPGQLFAVSFITPCSVTHSIQMEASTIQLPVTITGAGTLTFTIPTGTFGPMFLEGWYHLFLVAQDKSYSTGKWVKVL